MRRLLAAALAASAATTAAVGLPAEAGPATRHFSTPVHVDTSAANLTGEPSIAVARDGTEYIVAPGGAPGVRAPLALGGGGVGGALIWRSLDRGRTWTWLGSYDAPGAGGDTDISVTPNGTLYASSLSSVACSGVGVSTDKGQSWRFDPIAGCARMPLLNDRQWTATYGDSTVYTVIGAPLTGAIDLVRASTTGPLVLPATTLELYGGGDYEWPGAVAVDQRRATAYVVWNTTGSPDNCDQSSGASDCAPTAASSKVPDRIYVSAVPDDAASAPTPVVVASRAFDTYDSFVSDAVDAAGNVYVAWSERHPAQRQTWIMLSVSRTGGRTWSRPVRVGRSATAVFPWLAAGDAGRLAVSYYGTASPGNSPQTVPASATWNVFSAFSVDYGRSFADYRTTPTMQQGPICTSGTGCAASSRNLLDFFESAIDPQGCLVTSYADNHAHGSAAIVTYVRQTSGPGLRSRPCR